MSIAVHRSVVLQASTDADYQAALTQLQALHQQHPEWELHADPLLRRVRADTHQTLNAADLTET